MLFSLVFKSFTVNYEQRKALKGLKKDLGINRDVHGISNNNNHAWAADTIVAIFLA